MVAQSASRGTRSRLTSTRVSSQSRLCDRVREASTSSSARATSASAAARAWARTIAALRAPARDSSSPRSSALAITPR